MPDDPTHLTSMPGRGAKCACGEKAITFTRCQVCGEMHVRCGNVMKCGDAIRAAEDCCRPPWETREHPDPGAEYGDDWPSESEIMPDIGGKG